MTGRADRQRLFGFGGRKPADREMASLHAPDFRMPDEDMDEERIVRLNLKAIAGAATAPPIRYATREMAALEPVGLTSRPAWIADTTRPGFGYWCEALRCRPRPQRKLWEFSQVLQAFYENGVLVEGARVLGFGVGDEPLASYMASLGVDVVATDLPGVTSREAVLRAHMIEGDVFDAHVEVSDVDIRRLDDPTLRGFDGVWSCSVVNELSTVEAASEALIGAMDVLKPGGVAVHTTEFAFAQDVVRQHSGSLRFPRKFFQGLHDALEGRGHKVAPLSFSLGDHPMDAYVDLEPYEVTGSQAMTDLWREGLGVPHLKVLSGGVLTTSFAVVVTRRP